MLDMQEFIDLYQNASEEVKAQVRELLNIPEEQSEVSE